MLMALIWLVAGMAGAGVGLVIVAERKLRKYDRAHPRRNVVPIKTVNGLSRPIDTSACETWASAPVRDADTQTRETLYRAPDGTWVLHIAKGYWPLKPGHPLIEDSWQAYNDQHAASWMQQHGVTMPEDLKPVASAMERRGRRARRTRRPSA